MPVQHRIDAKSVDRKAFRDGCQSNKIVHAFISESKLGNHGFTTRRGFDTFCRKNPHLREAYSASERRRKRALKLRDKLGERRLSLLLGREQKLLESADALVSKLLRDSDIRTTKRETELLRAAVSPKIGSAAFYRSSNFTSRFARVAGLLHINTPDLGGNKNMMSSLILVSLPSPVYIELFDGNCWTSASRLFAIGPHTERRFRLGVYNFKNRTNSFWFWF